MSLIIEGQYVNGQSYILKHVDNPQIVVYSIISVFNGYKNHVATFADESQATNYLYLLREYECDNTEYYIAPIPVF